MATRRRYPRLIKALTSQKSDEAVTSAISEADSTFIREGGGLAPLLALFSSSSEVVLHAAVAAVCAFVEEAAEHGLLIIKKGRMTDSWDGLQPFFTLLAATEDEELQDSALKAVRTIATELVYMPSTEEKAECKRALLSGGDALAVLVHLLASKRPSMRAGSLYILCLLLNDSDPELTPGMRLALLDDGVVPAVLPLASADAERGGGDSEDEDVRVGALRLMLELSVEPIFISQLISAGGVAVLVDTVQRGTEALSKGSLPARQWLEWAVLILTRVVFVPGDDVPAGLAAMVSTLQLGILDDEALAAAAAKKGGKKAAKKGGKRADSRRAATAEEEKGGDGSGGGEEDRRDSLLVPRTPFSYSSPVPGGDRGPGSRPLSSGGGQPARAGSIALLRTVAEALGSIVQRSDSLRVQLCRTPEALTTLLSLLSDEAAPPLLRNVLEKTVMHCICVTAEAPSSPVAGSSEGGGGSGGSGEGSDGTTDKRLSVSSSLSSQFHSLATPQTVDGAVLGGDEPYLTALPLLELVSHADIDVVRRGTRLLAVIAQAADNARALAEEQLLPPAVAAVSTLAALPGFTTWAAVPLAAAGKKKKKPAAKKKAAAADDGSGDGGAAAGGAGDGGDDAAAAALQMALQEPVARWMALLSAVLDAKPELLHDMAGGEAGLVTALLAVLSLGPVSEDDYAFMPEPADVLLMDASLFNWLGEGGPCGSLNLRCLVAGVLARLAQGLRQPLPEEAPPAVAEAAVADGSATDLADAAAAVEAAEEEISGSGSDATHFISSIDMLRQLLRNCQQQHVRSSLLRLLAALPHTAGGRAAIVTAGGGVLPERFPEPDSEAADDDGSSGEAKESAADGGDGGDGGDGDDGDDGDGSAASRLGSVLLLMEDMLAIMGDAERNALHVQLAADVLAGLTWEQRLHGGEQPLLADVLAFHLLRAGGLVTIAAVMDVALFAGQRVPPVGSFTAQLQSLALHLSSRGHVREQYWAAQAAALAAAAAEAEASGKKVKAKKGKKGKKRGAASSGGADEEEGEQNADPHAGPTMQHWLPLLDASFDLPRCRLLASTAVDAACSSRSTALLQSLIACGAAVNTVDGDGQSPLARSISLGSRKLTTLLLEAGADPDTMIGGGDNVLKLSMVAPSARKTVSLLRYYAQHDYHEEEELPTATGSSGLDDLMLAHGADANVSDDGGNFPLHWVVSGVSVHAHYSTFDGVLVSNSSGFGPGSDRVARAKRLLEAGANVNACNKRGETALHIAVRCGHGDVAMLLLAAGADPNIIDADGNLPLHFACCGLCGAESCDIVAALVEAGAGKPITQGQHVDNRKGRSRQQKLASELDAILDAGWASVVCPSALVEKQVEAAALVQLQNKSGLSPLHVSCGALLDSAADSDKGAAAAAVDAATTDRPADGSDMYDAEDVAAQRAAIAAFLISRGADVHARAAGGTVPMHFAAITCGYSDAHEAVLHELLAAGGDINAVDSQSRCGGGGCRFSPLHYAILGGSRDSPMVLVREGAAPLAATSNPPALALAAEHGCHPMLLGYLASAGVNVRGSAVPVGQQLRRYTGTALSLAAQQGQLEVVQALLLAEGIDVHAVRPHSRRSALHLAAFNDHGDIVACLLRAGADVTAVDVDGRTPLATAAAAGAASALAAMLEEGAIADDVLAAVLATADASALKPMALVAPDVRHVLEQGSKRVAAASAPAAAGEEEETAADAVEEM